jgi:hypothetical protein
MGGQQFSRRALLGAVGCGIVGTTAGCGSDSSETQSSPTPPESTGAAEALESWVVAERDKLVYGMHHDIESLRANVTDIGIEEAELGGSVISHYADWFDGIDESNLTDRVFVHVGADTSLSVDAYEGTFNVTAFSESIAASPYSDGGDYRGYTVAAEDVDAGEEAFQLAMTSDTFLTARNRESLKRFVDTAAGDGARMVDENDQFRRAVAVGSGESMTWFRASPDPMDAVNGKPAGRVAAAQGATVDGATTRFRLAYVLDSTASESAAQALSEVIDSYPVNASTVARDGTLLSASGSYDSEDAEFVFRSFPAGETDTYPIPVEAADAGTERATSPIPTTLDVSHGDDD